MNKNNGTILSFSNDIPLEFTREGFEALDYTTIGEIKNPEPPKSKAVKFTSEQSMGAVTSDDLHDALDTLDEDALCACPKCESDNVKLAIHNPKRGMDFSGWCYACLHEETGVNMNVHDFVKRWYR